MLIATPYRSFDVRDKSPPRIISEIRKSYASGSSPHFKPKLTGEVLLKCGGDRNWWPRRVSIRCGHLLVSNVRGEEGPAGIRLPLRHLSLQAGPLPNSLSLCRGANVILTLQTSNERAFDEWVKSIAIELIRQTPLDAIKYLDILTIAECWKRKEENYEKDWNFNNCQTTKPVDSCSSCKNNNQKNVNCNPSYKTPGKSAKIEEVVEEQNVEDLMKKCQNVEKYVPVKEKLFLFESLCKFGRRVRSTEDVSLRIETNSKRARSLHDLSNFNSHIAVREICKYFENKNESPGNSTVSNYKTRRLVNSDSQLNEVCKFNKVFTSCS